MTRARSKPAPKTRRYKVEFVLIERENAEPESVIHWWEPDEIAQDVTRALVEGLDKRWTSFSPSSIKVRRITPERKRK